MISSVLTASDCSVRQDSPYRLAPEALLVMVEDGSARIVDLEGAVAALDATAATMIEAVLRLGEARAVVELAHAFGVPPHRIKTDLQAVLRNLVARGALRSGASDVPRRARQTRRRVASSLSAVAVRWVGADRAWGTQAWHALTVAHLSLRLVGWSFTIGAWIAPGRAGWNPRGRAARNDNECAGNVRAIDAAVTRAMARYPRPLDCKERALTAFALTRASGLPARIVLGISLFPLALHVWCESDGQVLADQFDGYCDRYTPIRIYG